MSVARRTPSFIGIIAPFDDGDVLQLRFEILAALLSAGVACLAGPEDRRREDYWRGRRRRAFEEWSCSLLLYTRRLSVRTAPLPPKHERAGRAIKVN
jgi:hypothetical protein